MEFPFRIGHSRIRALLSSYVDGEVSAAEARRVEEHAAACSACRDELDSLTATVELVRALPEFELPRSFELTSLPEEEARVGFGVWAPRLATSVAGLLLVILLAGEFTGTLVQYGGSDEEATEAQADASGAMDVEASAPAAAPPQASRIRMADAAAATPTPVVAAKAAKAAAAQLDGSDEEAATPEPPSAPAAAAKSGPAGMPGPASATPAAADAPAGAMKASVPAAAQPSPEPATAPSVAQAPDQTEAPIPTWDASVGDDADGGIGVPLLELQIVAAVCLLALGAATVWRARRRRRRV